MSTDKSGPRRVLRARLRSRLAHPLPSKPTASAALLKLLRHAVRLGLVIGCVGQASCSYLDRARRVSDTAVEVSQGLALQAVIEANTERQRLRRLRCIDPLLTPATLSSAAADPRLGQAWVDELLRDCPAFTAFLINSAVSRLSASGISLPAQAKSQ